MENALYVICTAVLVSVVVWLLNPLAKLLKLFNFQSSLPDGVRPFEEMPGPAGLPYFGCVHRYLKSPGFTQQMKLWKSFFDQYGPVFRQTIMGHTMVMVTNPREIEKVIKADGKYPERPVQKVFKAFKQYNRSRNRPGGILELNGEDWSRLRKALAPKMLRPKDIRENLENFNTVNTDAIEHLIAIRGTQGVEGEIPDLEGELSKWATESVPLLTYLLNKGQLTIEEIDMNCIGMFKAGIETTARGMIWLLYELARSPRAQERVYEEVTSLVGPHGDFTPETFAKLNYIKACVKEMMRLRPVASSWPRKLTKDVVLAGYQVPAGVFTKRERDTKMEENRRIILGRHFVEIRRVLDPDQVLPYFIQEGVMSDEDIAKIKAQTTRHEKVDVFIDVLKRSNNRAFDVFIEALEEVHEHLACLLRPEVEEPKTMHTNEKANKDLKKTTRQGHDFSKECDEMSEENELLEMQLVEATLFKSKCEYLEMQLEEAKVFKSKSEQLEKQPEKATVVKSKCEQLEKQLEDATVSKGECEQLERQLVEATLFKSKCEYLEMQLEEATVFKGECEQLQRQVEEATVSKSKCEQLERLLEEATLHKMKYELLKRQLKEVTLLKAKCVLLEKQQKEATPLKSKCEQLEMQLEKALERQLEEATAISTRHQPESTPDSVDGATSPADLSRSDFEDTETPKRKGKGFRPTSAKTREQLTREKKAIEDDDKKFKELLESAERDFEQSSYTMMEEKHRKLLRRFKKELLKDLDGLRCLPHLVEVLDQTDEDEIKAETTRVKQCEKLLEILPRRGPAAFAIFIDALLEVQSHLGYLLLQAIDFD